jgi:hypothetical protein
LEPLDRMIEVDDRSELLLDSFAKQLIKTLSTLAWLANKKPFSSED